MISIAALAAAGALLLTHLIGSYWHFYRLGTSGANGFALLFVILPASFIILAVAIAVADRWLQQRGRGRGRRLAISVV